MEAARDRVFVCDEPATNALLHRLYPDAQEVGRYAIYTMRTGRILRVPAASLWPRLPPAEEEQARYFIQRMNDELPGAVAGMVSRGHGTLRRPRRRQQYPRSEW